MQKCDFNKWNRAEGKTRCNQRHLCLENQLHLMKYDSTGGCLLRRDAEYDL